jgi:uncharacterized protein (TIGR02466 family)
MEKHAWKLFPTPVNYFKQVLSPEQLAIIKQHCLDVEAGGHGAFFGDSKSSFSRSSRLVDDLDAAYPQLRGLKRGLSALLKEYGKELGFNDLEMSNSWFNVQYPGSILKHHLHSDSRVSAALCIESDDKSSKLCLENPNPILSLIKPDTHTDATFEFAKFSLDPGDMLLFPSWIKHGSGHEPNQSEHRIMISFNAS